MKYDWSKVRPEVWTRTLAALQDHSYTLGILPQYSTGIELLSCLQMARAEAAVPLRTRAEVDAEKLKVAASFFAGYQHEIVCRQNWERLCAEPVSLGREKP